MSDFDLFVLVSRAFGLSFDLFQAAFDFDVCVAFRDSERVLRWMFYFDPDSGSLLQVQKN